MTMWCQLILSGALSLRAASRVFSIILPYFNLELSSTPSWYTGRLWLMRLGYYKLHRAKVKSNDWVWIIDHSVQIGKEKCLVILGLRLRELPKERSLTYEDVEPIEILPVSESNGTIVYKQLEAVIEKTGVPRMIISDYGSDIKSGIEKFCLLHQETDYIYDVKHKIASMFKKVLEGNKRWELFIKLASQAKHQVQQTSLVALAPPAQRAKARYMNTEYLLRWGEKMILFLSQSDKEISQHGYEVAKTRKKLGWVMRFRDDIKYWNSLTEIASIAENFIRNKGLYTDSDFKLRELFNESENLCNSESTLQFKKDVLDFVRNESQKAKPGECLLGSSEIIESVFGKQKFIEKEQSKRGFTGLLLTLGSIVSKTSIEVVKQAMESTSTKIIYDWYHQHIKQSEQAQRAKWISLCNLKTV